jgi:hypothetical protein
MTAVAWGPMTDTTELPLLSGARLAAAETQWIPLPVTFVGPPEPQPQPTPQRLPKRLRRRAAAHLALAFTAAAGFATALLAGGVL